jgi:hypothetical protein
LRFCPTPLEFDSLEEEPDEDFFPACVEEGLVELGVVVLGVVDAGVDVCPAPVPELAPVLDTLITCAGPAEAFEAGALERPISTPTPIESSSTPTPAMTAVVLPGRGASAAGAPRCGPAACCPAASSAAVGCLAERRAPRSSASALPRRGLRVPHSRQ